MNTAIGKYVPSNTVLHRIDARIKLIALILGMVSVFLNYGVKNGTGTELYMNLVIEGVLFLLLSVLFLVGKVRFLQLFRQLSALWSMVLFLLLINFFFPGNVSGEVAFHLGSNHPVYYFTLFNLLYVFIRLLLFLMMTDLFTTTTKPMEMTGALEWLFTPLKLLHVPVHKFAMALSLALRFIPTLIDEANRIMKAQASRGVDYRQGSFKDKIRSLTSLIIPLFMASVLTSGELADAMEARGYDPDSRRTRYRVYRWGTKDTVALALLLLFLAAMVTEAVLHYDLFVAFNVPVPILRGSVA